MERNFDQQGLKPMVIENDKDSVFPVDAYKNMGELGIIGLPYPKDYLDLLW